MRGQRKAQKLLRVTSMFQLCLARPSPQVLTSATIQCQRCAPGFKVTGQGQQSLNFQPQQFFPGVAAWGPLLLTHCWFLPGPSSLPPLTAFCLTIHCGPQYCAWDSCQKDSISGCLYYSSGSHSYSCTTCVCRFIKDHVCFVPTPLTCT